jgi:hypothetical protein
VDRPDRNHAGYVPALALNGDSLSLDLLIKEGRDLARYPPEPEIAVIPNPSDDVTRLIQRTGHKPFQ